MVSMMISAKTSKRASTAKFSNICLALAIITITSYVLISTGVDNINGASDGITALVTGSGFECSQFVTNSNMRYCLDLSTNILYTVPKDTRDSFYKAATETYGYDAKTNSYVRIDCVPGSCVTVKPDLLHNSMVTVDQLPAIKSTVTNTVVTSGSNSNEIIQPTESSIVYYYYYTESGEEIWVPADVKMGEDWKRDGAGTSKTYSQMTPFEKNQVVDSWAIVWDKNNNLVYVGDIKPTTDSSPKAAQDQDGNTVQDTSNNPSTANPSTTTVPPSSTCTEAQQDFEELNQRYEKTKVTAAYSNPTVELRTEDGGTDAYYSYTFSKTVKNQEYKYQYEKKIGDYLWKITGPDGKVAYYKESSFMYGVTGSGEFVDKDGKPLSKDESDQLKKDFDLKTVTEGLQGGKKTVGDAAKQAADTAEKNGLELNKVKEARIAMYNSLTGKAREKLNTILNAYLHDRLGKFSWGIPAAMCGDKLYRKDPGHTSIAGVSVPTSTVGSTKERDILSDIKTTLIEGEKNEITPASYRYAFSVKIIGDRSEQYRLYLFNSCTNESSFSQDLDIETNGATDGVSYWYDDGSISKYEFKGKHYTIALDCSDGGNCRYNQVCIAYSGSGNLTIDTPPYRCVTLANGDGFFTEGQTGSKEC